MSLHRVREGLKEERTVCINRIRGVLAEFGLVFAQNPKVLRAVLADVIEDASNELSAMARHVLQRAFDHWRELDEHMRWCDSQGGQHVRSSPAAQRAAKITGIGELGASGLTAGVGDFHQFKGGHQLGAWLGLVPKQNSSGGKTSLGRIVDPAAAAARGGCRRWRGPCRPCAGQSVQGVFVEHWSISFAVEVSGSRGRACCRARQRRGRGRRQVVAAIHGRSRIESTLRKLANGSSAPRAGRLKSAGAASARQALRPGRRGSLARGAGGASICQRTTRRAQRRCD